MIDPKDLLAALVDPNSKEAAKARPLHALTKEAYPAWLDQQSPRDRRWLGETDYAPNAGALALLADESGAVEQAVLGLGDGKDPWTWAYGAKLAPGVYRLSETLDPDQAVWAAYAWAMAGYSYDDLKGQSGSKSKKKGKGAKARPRLVWPEEADQALVQAWVKGAATARTLINTPANLMGPEELADALKAVTKGARGAKIVITQGEELEQNFPAIHAVGKGSPRAPRLLDLTWGKKTAPKVTIVGKGVCFDTGGLDLKPPSAMKLMKKDMGGAAQAIALAQMILAAKLPVRLRVLIPAVENSVSGKAYRPGDVIESRKGLSIEIGNTDAEGRVVMSDALDLACEEKPDLLIDLATLTGAARSALGPEVAAMFCNEDDLAAALAQESEARHDPFWRMPLWAPYRSMIDGKHGDINNAGESPMAGAITAALFLQSFVGSGIPWAHFDLYGWNGSAKPGRSWGGAEMTIRAIFSLLVNRYEKSS